MAVMKALKSASKSLIVNSTRSLSPTLSPMAANFSNAQDFSKVIYNGLFTFCCFVKSAEKKEMASGGLLREELLKFDPKCMSNGAFNC